tara:strand:+ start:185 stop:367 length:183 start_codon:yes stop_codon:yes gene_type:complete
VLAVHSKNPYNKCMIEIKGRKFEGVLEEIIKTDEDFRQVLEEIYTVEYDQHGEITTIRWD